MVKQRDISQIQGGIGDIHRDGIVNVVTAGQGDIAAVGDLQDTVASDSIGKGAAKAAQRQNILCACQSNAGRHPEIIGRADRQCAAVRQGILTGEATVIARERDSCAIVDIHRGASHAAQGIGHSTTEAVQHQMGGGGLQIYRGG
ncbi:Uncharacterised protein [Yersinia aleksiciae]|nr:Uncharacterised protein [Yersinia aleksiciae]